MKNHLPLRMCGFVGALGILLSTRLALAQGSGNRAADEAAVRQAGKDYLAAMARADVKALADFWTADGTYTDETGKTVNVHDLLAKSAAGSGAPTPAVAAPPTSVSQVTVRFVTDDVAIENGDCETALENGKEPITGHYTALWVKQSGRWKLDSLKEYRTPAETSGSDELASLGVFVGEWSGKMNDSTIHISAKWDATKKFLRREIAISGGKVSLNGTQEIGWDPLAQHIKSWMFIDDGSYSEGLWSLEGTVWMEASQRVLPDGKISKATQVYKVPDKNTLIWKLIHGSVDGQPAQDFEVTLKRS
ncbi:MAG TPA: DUF4440 domain-containing protein [Pirellulales bacterium]|nr:DUF4440 domain-containing protein [Pirellulales bacterium]